MAATSTVAQQLCTKSDLALFTESLIRHVKALEDKAQRSRIVRARQLRDKYHNLANRQDREARGKQRPCRRQPSQGSAATRKKEQIFSESLTRFENQQAKVADDKKTAKQPGNKRSKKRSSLSAATRRKAATVTKSRTKENSAAQKKKTAVKKKAARKKKKAALHIATALEPVAKVHPQKSVQISAARKKATASAKRTRTIASGMTRKQKHRSAENRRHQARRDYR